MAAQVCRFGQLDAKLANQLEPIVQALYPIEVCKQSKTTPGSCWRYNESLATDGMKARKPFFFEYIQRVQKIEVKNEEE